MKSRFRLFAVLLAFAALATCVYLLALPSKPAVQLNAAHIGPRQIEEATGRAIVRDYAAAWEDLVVALDENRADLIDGNFVGLARDKFLQAIAEQKQSGLRTRYVDHGHKLEALFYSPEGASMELRDTATLEVQVLDGDRVLYSAPITAHYIVLMTPAADRWQVRLLQETPQ